MKKWPLFRIAILVAFAGAVIWIIRRNDLNPSSNSTVIVQSPAERLSANLQNLRSSKTETDSKTSMAELKRVLRQMDSQEARDWILLELEHAEDFATHLDLAISTDQNLGNWPSYRVFLLDMLFLIDPDLAAEKSRKLLEKSRSPDEWAVAMRNIARANASGKDLELLRIKSAELLRNKEWRAQPSSGYLEAFDLIVYTKNTAMLPDLVNLCDDRDHSAVRHAAFLVLDHLALSQPGKVLENLSKNADDHPQSGLMISNMIARADVRDTVQRSMVETYLLSDKRSIEELQGFASVFPNANFSVSNNLLTKSAIASGDELAAKDRAALEVVAAWLTDPKFSRSHTHLRETYKRLKNFVDH